MGLSRADLTTIATRTGAKVVAAWSTRDAGTMGSVVGVVMHHTGSSQASAAVAPTLGIVRDGRSDLQNALCTYYIDKAGAIYLITEKIAWHAGQGAYRGITDGNGHLLGIEAESDGKTWTQATVDSFIALVAEICRFLGVDPNVWAIRHATWATPPGRKTDFAGLSEAGFKARVVARINGVATPTPGGFLMALSDAEQAELLTRVRALDAFRDWGFVPDDGSTFPNSKGELTKRLRSIDATLPVLLSRNPSVDVDAATIAAAIPADLAAQVADELAKRLAS